MPISIIQKLEEHTGIMNVNFKRAQIVYDLLSPQAWKCNTWVQLQNVRSGVSKQSRCCSVSGCFTNLSHSASDSDLS